jgi:predicted transcriptional regulator of viral defense system
MNQVEALARIESLGQPVFQTKDVTAAVGVTPTNANKIATRLAASGFLIRLARGRWMLARERNKLLVPEELTAPYPAYISLQTALYHHGMVSQIPTVTYAVSLAKTRRYHTPIGTFSIHHVAPDFFFGFERNRTNVPIALPEKALLDVLYLSQTKTRLFVSLPELDIPKNFHWHKAAEFASSIHSVARRRSVEEKLSELKRRTRGQV